MNVVGPNVRGTDSVFSCRTCTTELTVTRGRWFLSVCYRKAISPYAHLVSGGKATVARMFVNMTQDRGLVCQYDVVCFDEVSGVSFDQSATCSVPCPPRCEMTRP